MEYSFKLEFLVAYVYQSLYTYKSMMYMTLIVMINARLKFSNVFTNGQSMLSHLKQEFL